MPYRLYKVGPRLAHTVTTEALIFDRQRKSFTTFYNTCCGFNQIQVNPGQFIDVVGFSGQLLVEGRDRCTGVWQDTTTSAFYSSFNTTVATVGPPAGAVSGVGVGSTTVRSELEWSRPLRIDPSYCISFSIGDDTPTEVIPTVTIQPGADNVPLRAAGSTGPNSIQLAASGLPVGGSFHWDTTSNKVSLSNENSATVTVTSVAASNGRNDVPITVTYTVNNVDSDPVTVNITVVKPTRLVLAVPGSTAANNCSAGLAGPIREPVWEVHDQFTPTSQAIPFAAMGASDVDDFDIISQNCGVGGTETGTFPTNNQGQFGDTYDMCSPECGTGQQCQLDATQVWTVNGFRLASDPKALVFTCSTITINGQ